MRTMIVSLIWLAATLVPAAPAQDPPDEADMFTLLETLRSEDPSVREAAFKQLPGHVPKDLPAKIEQLQRLVRDSHPEVRRGVIECVARIRGFRLTRARTRICMAALGDSETKIRRRAAHLIADRGWGLDFRRSIPPVWLRAVQDPDDEVALTMLSPLVEYLRATSGFHPFNTYRVPFKLMAEIAESRRSAALRAAALGVVASYTEQPAAVTAILDRRLDDPSVIVRDAALRAFHGRGLRKRSRRVESYALGQLNDPDPIRRKIALTSLRPMAPGRFRVTDGIARCLHDPSPIVRVAAVYALTELGTEALQREAAIRRLARDPDPDVRHVVQRVLKRLDRYRTGLEEDLSDATSVNPEVRVGAVVRLSYRGTLGRTALIAALADPCRSIRDLAARGLIRSASTRQVAAAFRASRSPRARGALLAAVENALLPSRADGTDEDAWRARAHALATELTAEIQMARHGRSATVRNPARGIARLLHSSGQADRPSDAPAGIALRIERVPEPLSSVHVMFGRLGFRTPVAITDDGRFIAFCAVNVHVLDRSTKRMVTVSRTSRGRAIGYGCHSVVLAQDGRTAAFESDAGNLVRDDDNKRSDVFVRDTTAGTTTRVSSSTDGAEATGDSTNPSLSRDGAIVAFESHAPDLVSGDTNGRSDVFVHDRITGATARTSLSAEGREGNDDSTQPQLSPDGRSVLFLSEADNLTPGDVNRKRDAFVRDLESGRIVRVSRAANDFAGGMTCRRARFFDQGRRVMFACTLDACWRNRNRALWYLVAHHLASGRSVIVLGPIDEPSRPYNFLSNFSVSDDGRRVVFSSKSDRLVAHDTNDTDDVFLLSTATGSISRVSVGSGGRQRDLPSSGGVISRDGRFVAFVSLSDDPPVLSRHLRDAYLFIRRLD